MNNIERQINCRPDLEIIKAAREERMQLGNYCDTCNVDFEDRSRRLIVLTSLPQGGKSPVVEVRLECNPSCDGSDGLIQND